MVRCTWQVAFIKLPLSYLHHCYLTDRCSVLWFCKPLQVQGDPIHEGKFLMLHWDSFVCPHNLCITHTKIWQNCYQDLELKIQASKVIYMENINMTCTGLFYLSWKMILYLVILTITYTFTKKMVII